jgi:hypothetical protein
MKVVRRWFRRPRRFWGGKRDLNPQQPVPQTGALPIELFPPRLMIIAIVRGAVRCAGMVLLGCSQKNSKSPVILSGGESSRSEVSRSRKTPTPGRGDGCRGPSTPWKVRFAQFPTTLRMTWKLLVLYCSRFIATVSARLPINFSTPKVLSS